MATSNAGIISEFARLVGDVEEQGAAISRIAFVVETTEGYMVGGTDAEGGSMAAIGLMEIGKGLLVRRVAEERQASREEGAATEMLKRLMDSLRGHSFLSDDED